MSTEFTLKLHPDAANKFRERGQALLTSLKLLSSNEISNHFKADRHSSITLTEENIVSMGPRQSLDPLSMKVNEICFWSENGEMILGEMECAELDNLSEAIQKTSDFKFRISHKFVRDTILSWLDESVNYKIDQDLPIYIVDKALSAIKPLEIWVPIANLAVEQTIDFGYAKVKPISKVQFDIWVNNLREGKKEDELIWLNTHLDKERDKFQGYAALCLTIDAEETYAIDEAIKKAGEIAAIFRLFHPANSQPRAAYYCCPFGKEKFESYSCIVIEKDTLSKTPSGLIPPYPDLWELSVDQLTQLEADFSPIRKILNPQGRTEFQQEVFDAIQLYTRSTLVREPTDKLVFIFSALESILLKNDNEPISTHIADRLAFVLGNTIEERRNIVKLVRICYGFRSKFLHHGQTLNDFNNLAKLMMYIWVFFIRLTKYANQFKTRIEFIDEIENRKYS